MLAGRMRTVLADVGDSNPFGFVNGLRPAEHFQKFH
jgi:hypothetical protein